MAKSTNMSQSSANDQVDSEDEEDTNSLCVPVKASRVSTPVSILIESLIEYICKMHERDSDKAQRAYRLFCSKLHDMKLLDESFGMEEFEGMRGQFRRCLVHLFKPNVRNDLSFNRPWSECIEDSHYSRQFQQIRKIAGGGFGQVYLARHKLDGTDYAIKKIPIKSEGIHSVRNYISEVKTLASLNHPNIVHYKAAWLEVGEPTRKAICNALETNKQQLSDSDDSDFEVCFEQSVSKLRSKSSPDLMMVKVDPPSFKWATLYIQMAVCQSTLKQWLQRRNHLESSKALVTIAAHEAATTTNVNVYAQLLRGIHYIHSKGIVHHDVKPSNIFVQLVDSGGLVVQLGDFGLACPLQSIVNHGAAFGTKLYAAPEQLAGRCHAESDLYSLGIVLYELVERFHTDMERVESIARLRNNKDIASSLEIRDKQMVAIIRELMSDKLEDRPNAKVLLERMERAMESNKVAQLKGVIEEKDQEIRHLKELLQAHGIVKGI